MTEETGLKNIRRQIYLYYIEDGLVDIGIGLVILGFGILLLLGLPAFIGLLGMPILGMWYGGKRILVFPRVGTIRPGRELRVRFRGFFLSMLFYGIGLLVLFLLRAGDFSLIIFGMVIGAGISTLGVLLSAIRFYVYGVLVFVLMAGGDILNGFTEGFDAFLSAVVIAGSLIILSGTMILFRFLKKYPVPVEENSDG